MSEIDWQKLYEELRHAIGLTYPDWLRAYDEAQAYHEAKERNSNNDSRSD